MANVKLTTAAASFTPEQSEMTITVLLPEAAGSDVSVWNDGQSASRA